MNNGSQVEYVIVDNRGRIPINAESGDNQRVDNKLASNDEEVFLLEWPADGGMIVQQPLAILNQAAITRICQDAEGLLVGLNCNLSPVARITRAEYLEEISLSG